MTKIKHQHQLITTQNAANEADRRVQDWISAHAGPNKPQAKKAVTTQGKYSNYSQHDLMLGSTTMELRALSRKSSIYTVHYQPEAMTSHYTAHALVIFPHDIAGSGALSITVHQPDDWSGHTPPWTNEFADPAEALAQILQRVKEQDHQQGRRRRNNRNIPTFQSLQEARKVYGPLVLFTPKGDKDPGFSAFMQEYRSCANIFSITESDQLNLSSEVPDESLRQWLSAKAVLVKESFDPVNADHPLTGFDELDLLRPILQSLQVGQSQAIQDMAHRSIIDAFKDLVAEYHALQEITDELQKQDPERFQTAAFKLLMEGVAEPTSTKDVQDGEAEANAARATQRISTLEDQLKEEQAKNEQAEGHLKELQAQVQAYEQYMDSNATAETPQNNPKTNPKTSPDTKSDSNPDSNPDTNPENSQDQETPPSRDDAVMEAITQPGRFPNLRFLNTTAKTLSEYGRARPKGQEIIDALDAIDSLAQIYTHSDNGNIGSWKEYFNLPGWTYANSESETTMGKFPGSRTFRDHENNRHIVVQRHLTYRGSNSGLQIFFDADTESGPFIIAYIGEHLPYASNRS